MRTTSKSIVKRYPKTSLSIIFLVCISILCVVSLKYPKYTLIQDIIRSEQSTPGGHSYRAVPPFTFQIEQAATLVPYLTDMVITPDNSHLLVATLQGKIFALNILPDGSLKKQKDPFYEVDTSDIGYPNIEIGLTGIALGADFETSGDVFLLYSYDNGKNGSLLKGKSYKARVFENRITKVDFTTTTNGVIGTHPETIFHGKDLTSQAHQIERAVGVMIEDKPHLLFTIGDGYEASSALDLSDEAGKMLLIQSDGSPALGKRPYPEHPLVQAIGIRNGSSIRYDKNTKKVLLTDTSNENFDRLIFGKVFDEEGVIAEPLSFLWNGSDTKLLSPVESTYDNSRNIILHRWSPSVTPVDSLIVNSKEATRILVVTFGETKSTRNKPGKRIELGTINNTGTLSSMVGLVERDPGAYEKLGNPISIEQNTDTGHIYFADFEEGNIYSFVLP